MPEKRFIYDFSYKELKVLLDGWGEPSFRITQIWEGLYSHLWNRPEEFPNIPKTLQSKFANEFSLSHLTPQKELVSADGYTNKTLLGLPDGTAVEAVLMEYDKRRTLCISTQVGCAVGCRFCATGQMGFQKNLTSGEIIEQVLFYARSLRKMGEKVTNIVYMGMGEPFLNYEATLESIKRLNHPEGFNLGARRFTISTVGIIPQIEKFTQEKSQINLAISLHAADNKLRSSLIPINEQYPIEDLMEVCQAYINHTGRRVTFEWALIHQINDSIEQAEKLSKLLKGMNCHVNVIPLNPTTDFDGKKALPQQVDAFTSILEKNKIPCTVRVRRGIDIQAGCGQLASS
ncbi:MAG: 23S rRNA (adenine(2503)-C(2))-methyltransferase RlmN [Anaerolineales bacterium]